MYAVNEFLLGKSFTLEELLHKLVRSLCNGFRNSRKESLYTVLKLFRDLGGGHIGFNGITVFIVFVSLHFYEVYIGNYPSAADNGNNNRAYSRAEHCL